MSMTIDGTLHVKDLANHIVEDKENFKGWCLHPLKAGVRWGLVISPDNRILNIMDSALSDGIHSLSLVDLIKIPKKIHKIAKDYFKNSITHIVYDIGILILGVGSSIYSIARIIKKWMINCPTKRFFLRIIPVLGIVDSAYLLANFSVLAAKEIIILRTEDKTLDKEQAKVKFNYHLLKLGKATTIATIGALGFVALYFGGISSTYFLVCETFITVCVFTSDIIKLKNKYLVSKKEE